MPASEYFRAVSHALHGLEATDRAGTRLTLDAAAARAVRMMAAVAAGGRTVFAIGNGGSCAIASHLHNDLAKGAALRTMTFLDAPLLTALANDEGYASVFERPLRLWAGPGDLLIAISSAGRSENILRGVGVCLERAAEVITLSGFAPDNPLRIRGALNFYVPASVYGHVEYAHGILTHFLSDAACAAAGLASV